jgi:HEAT repeat protein
MVRIALAAVIFTLLSISAQAQGLARIGKDEAREILSGYNYVPGAEYWGKMDPDSSRAVLLELSADTKELVHVRTRATLALANFPNAQVERHLLQTLTTEDRGYIRAAAVTAYSRVAGQAATPALERVLADKDQFVKHAAIKSLGEVGGAQSAGVLEKGLANEKDPVARSLMENSLNRINKR